MGTRAAGIRCTSGWRAKREMLESINRRERGVRGSGRRMRIESPGVKRKWRRKLDGCVKRWRGMLLGRERSCEIKRCTENHEDGDIGRFLTGVAGKTSLGDNRVKEKLDLMITAFPRTTKGSRRPSHSLSMVHVDSRLLERLSLHIQLHGSPPKDVRFRSITIENLGDLLERASFRFREEEVDRRDHGC